MPGIILKIDEPVDRALRSFKRQVERAGVLRDLRNKQYYDKPCVRKKKKSAQARKRRARQNKKFGYE